MSWPVTKLKWVATTAAGGTPSVSEPEYWAEEDKGLAWVSIGDMSSRETVLATSRRVTDLAIRATRLPVGNPGTLLFSMYASLGHTAFLGIPASWNQAILGIFPLPLYDKKFLYYSLNSLKPQLGELARSNTQENLNAEQVGNLEVPYPPREDQQRISAFLDHETERIAKLRGVRVRQRALITERLRQVIATLATHGDSTRLRQTGNPWIPEVPQNWIVTPLKRRWRIVDCKHRTPSYVDSGYPVVSPGDVSPGRLDLSTAHRFVDEVDFQDLADAIRRPLRGDIVYSRNASVGIAAYVDTDEAFTMGQDVCRITSRDQDQLFLAYFLNTAALAQLQAIQVGSTFTRVNIRTLLELSVPCPPPAEQTRIARLMDDAEKQALKLKSQVDRQLILLDERRQALITAAVTGQIDVSTASGRGIED